MFSFTTRGVKCKLNFVQMYKNIFTAWYNLVRVRLSKKLSKLFKFLKCTVMKRILKIEVDDVISVSNLIQSTLSNRDIHTKNSPLIGTVSPLIGTVSPLSGTVSPVISFQCRKSVIV